MRRVSRTIIECPVDTRRVYLRTQPPMNKPLLKPHGLQGACRYFAQNCSDVWTTKSSESFLSRIGFIWISIIERHIQTSNNEKRLKVSLKEHVDMYPLTNITAVAHVPQDWIKCGCALIEP